MRLKSISFFVGIILLIGLFGLASTASTLGTKPQRVTFVSEQGISLIGWLFKPDGNGPYPAVVMMPGCMGAYTFGENTQQISSIYLEWGERLTNAGYVALLVDSFTPRNAVKNQCGHGTLGISEIDDRPYDAYAGLDYLASQSFVAADKVGLMGWSHGASSALATMDERKFISESNFKAAVAFYPGCGLSNTFDDLKQSAWKPYAPFVILQGSADAVTKSADCMTRVAVAQELGATSVTINLFENAQHRFDGATQMADGFTQSDVDAKIAADAQVMRFFDMYLR